jgi:hypothetical protein
VTVERESKTVQLIRTSLPSFLSPRTTVYFDRLYCAGIF